LVLPYVRKFNISVLITHVQMTFCSDSYTPNAN